MDHQRDLLLAIRLEFSLQLEHHRQEALSRIVEGILELADPGQGFAFDEILASFSEASRGAQLRPEVVQGTIEELVDNGRVIAMPVESSERRFVLAPRVEQETHESYVRAERDLQRVAESLFSRRAGRYREALLQALSYIFASIGADSVRLLRNEAQPQEVIDGSSLEDCVSSACAESDDVDRTVLRDGVQLFLEDQHDPAYLDLKWRMAQNYFIAKVLGADPEGRFLNRQMFEGADLFLDTNILVGLLEPRDPMNSQIRAVIEANENLNLGMRLKIIEPTLNELSTWVEYQRWLLERTLDKVPGELVKRVSSLFVQIAAQMKQDRGSYNLDDVLASFSQPEETLRQFGVVVDEEYQTWLENDQATENFANRLRVRTERRGPAKTAKAAMHDAVLLRSVEERRRADPERPAWVLTNDRSLPGAVSTDTFQNVASTPEAMIQWLGVLGPTDEAPVSFKEAFAKMVAERVLPRERLFELEDFLIFEELNIDTAVLATADVEAAIEELRFRAPGVSPTDPHGRAEPAYIVSRFVAGPTRTHRETVHALEEEKRHAETLAARVSSLESALQEKAASDTRSKARVEELGNENKTLRERFGTLAIGAVAMVVFLAVESVAAGLVFLFSMDKTVLAAGPLAGGASWVFFHQVFGNRS